MIIMNEDEIIRKRLMVEGDSGQDDRRITGLFKTFLKWCAVDSLTEEETEGTFQKMLFTLGQVEFAISRTELIMEMNCKEEKQYDELVTSIEKQIKDTQEHIESLREELVKARLVRQHSQEYDALANVIMMTTAREDSSIRIQQLEKQLEELSNKHVQLSDQLSLRRKQGYLLMFSIHQLLDILNCDNIEPMEVIPQ